VGPRGTGQHIAQRIAHRSRVGEGGGPGAFLSVERWL
jgi:hypothetical protein